jgi:hypothetical protein
MRKNITCIMGAAAIAAALAGPAEGFKVSDTMRGYVTVVGMALSLVALWAALVPFVT